MPTAFQTIAADPDAGRVRILDQTLLPWQTVYRDLATLEQAAQAIRTMQVRGAPLIGVTAAFGIALAMAQRPDDAGLAHAVGILRSTRPTAVNLNWAIARMDAALRRCEAAGRCELAWREAQAIADEDARANAAIGRHGLALLDALAAGRGRVRVLTHCNAGWLATVAHGTALAPVYAAHSSGIAVEVWVSETRPRNQGLLTEWELRQAGIAHTLISDNSAGHLLARGAVDLVIVGADRIAANGDTANKIGTYLKALAAADCGIDFHVAAPLSTVDWNTRDGGGIPIEQRAAAEVSHVSGVDASGRPAELKLVPAETAVSNPAFDVTPARLIRNFITERGCIAPGQLRRLAPPSGSALPL